MSWKIEGIIGLLSGRAAGVEAKNVGFFRVGQSNKNPGWVRAQVLSPKRPDIEKSPKILS
jgi:hypothetical protein